MRVVLDDICVVHMPDWGKRRIIGDGLSADV